MRILIQTINFPPELTGTGKIMGEMASWLAARGHQVRVITAPPYYPQWRVHAGYRASRYRRERLSDVPVEVWRCPTWVPRRPTGVKRLLHLASFALSTIPVLAAQLRWRPEVVLVTEPTLFCLPGVLLTAACVRARTWLTIQDFEIEAAAALGILRWPAVQRLAAGVERGLMRRVDCVSSISPAMLERACARGARRGRAVLLRNWVNLDAIQEDPAASADLRRRWGIAPDQIVALYSGNLGVKQGVEMIVEAARALSSYPRLQFLICGDGAAKDVIARAAAALPNLTLRELVPAEQFNALLHLADIHLLPQRAEAADLVMPSKLICMLATNRPIVATAGAATEIGTAVVRAGGILVPPGDQGALNQALLTICENRQHWSAQSRAGRAVAAADYDQQGILEAFEVRLRELLAAVPAKYSRGRAPQEW